METIDIYLRLPDDDPDSDTTQVEEPDSTDHPGIPPKK